uniref:beta strand repeat-containing protein n=1 Tax=Herbaspirillum huttiense TaxID=863372 RepID=UPI0039F6C969
SNGFAAGDQYTNIQNVIGSNYDDLFIADNNANSFAGGTGSNTVSYVNSTAAVTVNLANGSGSGGFPQGDSYSSIQNVIGSAFDDTILASSDANFIDGGSSTASSHNRVSYANSSAGVTVDLNYTDGTGTSGGYAAGDTYTNVQDLTGSIYDDTFVASAVANHFDGGGGNNTVSYARANDGNGVTVDLFQRVGSNGFAAGDQYTNIQNVIGSNYDDLFIADNNANSFAGGAGSNTVSYVNSTAAVTVNLANGSGSGGFAQGDSYSSIQNVIGSSFDDTIIANSAANFIDGGSSTASSHNRVSYANSSAAVTVDLNYTNGTGTSGGYAAGDKLSNMQDLTGSSFDDTFVASAAANNFDGGTSTASSHNRVSYANSNAAVTVNLNYTDGTGTSGGYAAGDTLTNIQDVTGSSFDDTFVASAAANRFDGGTSTASSHNRVSYASSTAGVVVDLNSTDGTGTSGGYAAGDTLVNVQDLTGSIYDDTFVASAAANNFDGGGGNNTVSYARANDGNGVTVDLFQRLGSNGFPAGDQYTNIQNVIGSNYDDLFIADNNANSFAGGTGSNTVSYVNSTAAVTVNLANGSGSGGFAQGDSYSSIQNVIGSAFDDTIIAM